MTLRDGWTTGGPPSRTIWKYRNRSGALPPACTPGSAQGLSSVQIKDWRASAKQALQFKAKAKSATLLRDPDLPLTRVQVVVRARRAAVARRGEPAGTGRTVRRGGVHRQPDSHLAEAVVQDEAQERHARRRDLQRSVSLPAFDGAHLK